MRCPKCEYLNFEDHERCRVCGYDLSLSLSAAPTVQSPPTASDAEEPAADLPLRADAAPRRAPMRGPARLPPGRPTSHEPFDLPLFEGGGNQPSDAHPLVSARGVARPPLAVRRPTMEGGRARASSSHTPSALTDTTTLDLDLSHDASLPQSDEPLVARLRPAITPPPAPHIDEPAPPATENAPVDLASIGRRIAAGLVDAAVLGSLGLVVVYLTLKATGLRTSEIARLPAAPLAAFLLLLAVGYFAMFTVLAGQTIGKMIYGIKVVGREGRRVRFGHAVVRAVVQILTVPLLGFGFLPALVGVDRRALYDRLAETEVVSVTSDA